MRIGRISGFDVKVHWSTLVIFSLIVLSLATVQLPEDAPTYGEGAYWVAALVAGLVFYASLMAHEVSHAVMARREGIEVESLTLWMLGGVASLHGEPRDPGGDLRIAGIGPAVSLALAVAFGLVAAAVGVVGGPTIVEATFAWLAGINGILALFNLIPAAPLDGGRILRAILWRTRGDRTAAAVAATRAGELFGYLLVGMGVARLLFGVGFGGVWFILLGWFVLNTARAERTQVHVRDALGDLKVRDVMTPAPVTAPADITVASLLDDYVLRTRHSAFPLVDADGRPAGLVTLTQVRGVARDERDEVLVHTVACSRDDVATAGPDDPLLDVVTTLNQCGHGRVLVVDGGEVVGIVTPTDIARALDVATLDEPTIDVRDRPTMGGLLEPRSRR